MGSVSADPSTATTQLAVYDSKVPAAVPVRTSAHGPDALGEKPSTETPVPAGAASHAEGHAAASAQTPLPEPSPELPWQADLITPPPQVLDGIETPEVDASRHLQQDTPDEASEGPMQQEVQSPSNLLPWLTECLPCVVLVSRNGLCGPFGYHLVAQICNGLSDRDVLAFACRRLARRGRRQRPAASFRGTRGPPSWSASSGRYRQGPSVICLAPLQPDAPHDKMGSLRICD